MCAVEFAAYSNEVVCFFRHKKIKHFQDKNLLSPMHRSYRSPVLRLYVSRNCWVQ